MVKTNLFSSRKKGSTGSYHQIRQSESYENVWDANAEKELRREYGDSADDDDSSALSSHDEEMRGFLKKKRRNSRSRSPRKSGGLGGLPTEVVFHKQTGYPSYYSTGFGKVMIFVISTMALYLLSFGMFGHGESDGDDSSNKTNHVSSSIHSILFDDDLVQLEEALREENNDGVLTFEDLEAALEDEGDEEMGRGVDDMVQESMNYVFMEDDDVEYEDERHNRIQRIAIVGERNSGVHWFQKKLQECFPDVAVTTSLSREGYYFQTEELNDPKIPTLVIPMFLNPYNWVETMRKNPKYMTNHMNIKDWHEFVTKEWTIGARPQRDEKIWDEINQDKQARACQMYFKYDEIIPCVKSGVPKGVKAKDFVDQYELRHDGSGTPYSNILELRADKINNFMSIMDWKHIEMVLPLQYETLVEDGGFHFFAEHLQEQSERNLACNSLDKSFIAPVFWDETEDLDDAYVSWMDEHISWEQEWLIGYDYWSKNELQKKPKIEPVQVPAEPPASSPSEVSGPKTAFPSNSRTSWTPPSNSKDYEIEDEESPEYFYEDEVSEDYNDVQETEKLEDDDSIIPQPVSAVVDYTHEDMNEYVKQKAMNSPQAQPKTSNTYQNQSQTATGTAPPAPKEGDEVIGDLSHLAASPNKTPIQTKKREKKNDEAEMSSLEEMPEELRDDDMNERDDDME